MTVKELIDAAVRNRCPSDVQYASLYIWMHRNTETSIPYCFYTFVREAR